MSLRVNDDIPGVTVTGPSVTGSAHRRSLLVSALLAVAMMAAPLSPTAQGTRASHTCLGKAATKLGTPGNDVIFGTARRDVIVGRGGNDRINGGGGRDIICGGGGRDHINGGRGSDTLLGGFGNDSINGGRGFLGDSVDGGPGDDSIRGGRGPDELNGGAGDDLVVAGRGDFHLVDGGRGNDSITGGHGLDGLFGGPGDDSIDGGGDVDFLLGGESDLTFSTPIEVDLQTGVFTGEGTDAIANVEGAIGSEGDDVLAGNDESNFFVADEGDDELHGNGGFDVLYYFPDEPIEVDLNRGTSSGEGVDNFDGFEGVFGSEFADTLSGDASNNVMVGGRGDDTIDGGAGDDWLSGGTGKDDIDGGTGDYDLVDHSDCSCTVEVDLEAGTARGAGSDSLRRIEAITGTDGDDVLLGDAGVNFIFGHADSFISGLTFPFPRSPGGVPRNVISGRGGDDALDGGPGSDDVDGGEGTDQCGDDPRDTIAACEGSGLPPVHPLRDDARVTARVAVLARRNH